MTDLKPIIIHLSPAVSFYDAKHYAEEYGYTIHYTTRKKRKEYKQWLLEHSHGSNASA